MSALAEDGIIEGIEKENSDDYKTPLILGVQFHPERGIEENPFYISLFTYFISWIQPISATPIFIQKS